MKLQYKISIVVFILTAIVSAANYQVLTKTWQTLQVKRLEGAEALLGKSLAKKIYRQVIEEKKDSVTATLFKEKTLRDNNLDYLIVFDRQGNLFSHTYLSAIPKNIYELSNNFNNEQDYRIDDFLENDLAVYNIAVPIKEGIIQVGTLHIGIGKEFIADSISPLKKASTQLIIIGIGISLIAGSLAIAVSFAITKSLTRLQQLATNISNGNYDVKIDIKANDEVGRLADSFRIMRNNIKEALKKLEEQNLTLEATIEERTKELKQNNAQLAEQTKNLDIVFSAIDYPVYLIDTDYTIRLMNDATQALKTEKTKHPDKCFSLLFNLDSPCPQCPFPTIINLESSTITEREEESAQGEKKTFALRAYPIFDENHNVVQMLEACADISEQKKAEREKIDLERELSRAHKLESIGTLAAGVSHEINTPIQFIGDNTRFAEESCADLFDIIENYKMLLGKIEQGQEVNISKSIETIDDEGDLDYLTEELPKALQQTGEGVEHVSKIVKAMKDFSHIGSEVEMQPENLNHAIETTLTISKNEWKYVADTKKELDLSLPSVNCFIGEIKQVLLNFIVNASHAIADKSKNEGNSDKGVITIESSYSDDFVTVSVTDTGTGIDQTNREKIFDPFFTTKDVGKGSGQGLSMAYQIIVDKHKGKIWFDSELGHGTTFYFSLPLN